MPMLKSGGATLVAIAALCLATSAQAAIVNLSVVPSQSSLTIGGKIDASSIGGPGFANIQLLPQAPGANVTSYQGGITIDVTLGTLQLMPGSNVAAQVNGNWAPNNALNQTLTDPGNYGLALVVGTSPIGALRFADLHFDFGVPGPNPAVLNPVTPQPSTPMPLVLGSFNLAGQGAALIEPSFQYLTSGLGNGSGGIEDFPFINWGSTGADIGTWDGTTLTIPVHSTVTTVIQASPLVTQTITLTGQIVAVIVPEPSSMIMAGLGVIGLVAAGYRARKRKA